MNDDYLLKKNNHENENNLSVQAEQPTQAADDNNYVNQPQKDPVLDTIYETKSNDSSNIICRESLCVPNTNEEGKNSVSNQTLTTIRKESIEPKIGIGHIMMSYNRKSTKDLCTKIAEELRNLNYIVWIDEDNVSGDVQASVAVAIENSFVVLMAINEDYYKSEWCKAEAEYAFVRRKPRIPMLMQSGYKTINWLGFNIGSKRRVDFSKLKFDAAFKILVHEIEAVRKSLKTNVDDQTSVSSKIQSITTMKRSSTYSSNVHQWNADDVIEWLKREELEIFQDVLIRFTGETLWQLYKIKFHSPRDYYRTIESLLQPEIPGRLFYNLRFNAALESLFSSSIKLSMTDWFFPVILIGTIFLFIAFCISSIVNVLKH